eukprot:UN00481
MQFSQMCLLFLAYYPVLIEESTMKVLLLLVGVIYCYITVRLVHTGCCIPWISSIRCAPALFVLLYAFNLMLEDGLSSAIWIIYALSSVLVIVHIIYKYRQTKNKIEEEIQQQNIPEIVESLEYIHSKLVIGKP